MALAVLAVALLLPQDGRAASPGGARAPVHCEESWENGLEPYPYPFRGLPNNLPECRVGARGAEDLGTHAWALRDGRRLNMRRRLSSLEANPEAGGRVRWPLVDSLGRELAVLERHDDHWATYDPETGAPIYRDFTLHPRVFMVQGRGCMVDDALESRHALIAFPSHGLSTLGAGVSMVPVQIRAFIDRRALPEENDQGRPIRGVVDGYRAGCGESAATAAQPPRLHEDPGFDWRRHQFLGEDGLARTYATYNVKRLYQGARYMLVDTTGVHGGGIVRGVIRADDPLEEIDRLGYCDPNVVGGEPVASWSYSRVAGTRLEGWLARRCPERGA